MDASVNGAAVVDRDVLTEEDIAWRKTDNRRHILAERLRANGELLTGIALVLVYVGVAVAALVHFGSNLTQLTVTFQYAVAVNPPGPSIAHPFGVMNGVGIDELDALFRAAPIDLALVGGTILLAMTVGILMGAYAAFDAGTKDLIVTTIADIVVGVPPFFLVIVFFLGIVHLVPSSDDLLAFGILFAFVLWPYYARPVRARAQQVSTEAYVEASRAAGASPRRLLYRHVVPNSFFPVLAQVPVDVYNIFFVLTVFPFLGCFGAGAGGFFASITPLPSLPYPEWGYLLAAGACYGWSPVAAADHWWMYTFPALVILVFGIALALTCDGAERFLRVGRGAT